MDHFGTPAPTHRFFDLFAFYHNVHILRAGKRANTSLLAAAHVNVIELFGTDAPFTMLGFPPVSQAFTKAPLTPMPSVVVTRMAALYVGPLTMVNGCLRLGEGEAGNLVVWPPDFEVSIENDTIWVLYDDHEVEVRLGQVVRLGGGEVKSIEAFDKRTRRQIPAGCPGPYWLVGSISPVEAADLVGTEWVLTSLKGESLIEDTEITLYFEEAFLGGAMTCNGYGGGPDSGKYVAMDDGTLTVVRSLAVTVQLCSSPEGVMEQEEAYIEALLSGSAYRVVDDRLEIDDATGETVLVFAVEAAR